MRRNEQQRETLAQIGEFGLIERLQHLVDRYQEQQRVPGLILGIGDDAAAWLTQSGAAIATTDTMVQDIHFTRQMPWQDLGWKALAGNLSDVASMGGIPRYALITLALPPKTFVQNIEDLYRGILDIAGQYNVALAGGDIVSARSVIITIALYADASYAADGLPLFIRRNTGKPGDLLAVTGALGASAGGLALLLGRQPSVPAEPADIEFMRRAHFHPVPRVREGRLLLQAGVMTGMDLSDGLAGDIRRLCAQSRTGARINIADLPVPAQVSNVWGPEAAREFALYGGEDYELLIAAPASVMALAAEQLRTHDAAPLTVIGSLSEQAGTIDLVDPEGDEQPLLRSGWDHLLPHS